MFLSEWREFPLAPCLAGKRTWWQLVSRCCWNCARPWQASELVSLLAGLRTYQQHGMIKISAMFSLKIHVILEAHINRLVRLREKCYMFTTWTTSVLFACFVLHENTPSPVTRWVKGRAIIWRRRKQLKNSSVLFGREYSLLRRRSTLLLCLPISL